jgi:hypothetical protein
LSKTKANYIKPMENQPATPDLHAMADTLDAAIAAETPESIKDFVQQAYASYDANHCTLCAAACEPRIIDADQCHCLNAIQQ